LQILRFSAVFRRSICIKLLANAFCACYGKLAALLHVCQQRSRETFLRKRVSNEEGGQWM
jgi:hypothetical protein